MGDNFNSMQILRQIASDPSDEWTLISDDTVAGPPEITTQYVLPGHLIKLQLVIPRTPIDGSINWQIDQSAIFLHWTVGDPQTTCTLTPVTIFDDEYLTFCFWKPGRYVITGRAKWFNKYDSGTGPHAVQAEFVVVEPSWTFSASISHEVQYHSGEVGLVDYDNPTTNPRYFGLHFDMSVTMPPNDPPFEMGNWNLVQLTNCRFLNQTAPATPQSCEEMNTNGWVLDYLPDVGYQMYPESGSNPQADGTPVTNFGDAPAMPIDGIVQTKARAEFNTYLMFLPGQLHSEWVPLAKIHWWCIWCATVVTPVPTPPALPWTLNYWGQTADAVVPSVLGTPPPTHPTWTDYAPKAFTPGAACQDCQTGTRF
jgi:hypothetical protein